MKIAISKGLSLVELLLSAAILSVALSGILLLFINCSILNEANRNLSLAYNAMQAKMEEIKDTGFANLYVQCPSPRPTGVFCNQDAFTLNGFATGMSAGKIEISDADDDLKQVHIMACFRNRNRLIGNSVTNCTSSSAEIITLIGQ